MNISYFFSIKIFMKLDLPYKSNINNICINLLKDNIINYSNNYNLIKESQIYLYANYLKVFYNKKIYIITIISINTSLYWYLKPWHNTYLLIKYKTNINLNTILTLIHD